MNKVEALHAFWNSFELPAYDTLSVPDEAQMPYIAYEIATDNFGERLSLNTYVWYRSSSWQGIQAKVQEIADAISRGGKMIQYDGGVLWLQKGTPWAIRLGGEGDEYVKRISLNIEIEYID